VELSLPSFAAGQYPEIEEETIMAEQQLTLTAEEHAYLADLLANVLRDTRVEEHRTRTISYREHVLHREDLIKSILGKLGMPPA
jgi:hypothetical protein